MKYTFVLCSVDSDPTTRVAASDLGLHCLLKSLLCGSKHKWVKPKFKQTHYSSNDYIQEHIVVIVGSWKKFWH